MKVSGTIQESFEDFVKAAYAGQTVDPRQLEEMRKLWFAASANTFQKMLSLSDHEEGVAETMMSNLDREIKEHVLDTLAKLAMQKQ